MSQLSHTEFDEMVELATRAIPTNLAARYVRLRSALPSLQVIGGCCGTDQRHVAAIAHAWRGSVQVSTTFENCAFVPVSKSEQFDVSLGMLVVGVAGGRADAGEGVDAAVAEPVAGAFEGEDVGVVDDPVDHRGGHGLVAEHAAPSRERQV